MQRIGIFGGTFDPIHYGHLILAHQAQEQLALKKIFFVPAYIPPHKKRKIIESRHRVAMLQRALKNHPSFEISLHEVEQKKVCYTVDTLDYFKHSMPHSKLYFIAGSDNEKDLSTWHDLKQIFAYATFVMGVRPGFTFKKKYNQIRSISIHGLDISSSQIRERIKKGKSITYLVPESVIHYIRQNKLYIHHG